MPAESTLHQALDLRGNGELPKDGDKELNMDVIKEIIANADAALINQQNSVGQTALHMMAKFNAYRAEETVLKKEVAQLLLDAGARVDIVDDHGNTPMHIACMTAEPLGGITDKLCAAGASITDPEKMFGFTPLHWAAQTGLPDVIRPLLDLPNITEALEVQGKDGSKPLDLAIQGAEKKPYPFKSSSDIVKMIKAVQKK